MTEKLRYESKFQSE